MSLVHDLAAIDLNQLVVLDELLRSRSTTLAARRLGRTQSAVSHALRRLRATFDDPLFVRAGASLRPTTLAESIQAPLREVLLGAAAIVNRSRVAFDPSTIERSFTLSCTDLAEIEMLPHLMPRLRVTAPGVDLVTRFLGDDVERALQVREVDLGVGARFRPLAGLVVEPISRERMLVLLRRGHPALESRLTAKRYAALDHVLVTPRGLPGSSVDSALEPLGLTRRVVLRVPHFTSAALVVSRTDLVVTAPAGLAHQLAKPLGLRTVEVPFALDGTTFCIGYSASYADDPAHRWFREQLAGAARVASAGRGTAR
ncbi:MAG: LysR family transcriptional regulator [Polyangiaceae bacterium]|nr:LysR family transcriptional regulator [Polyangiaceae bacterium]